MGIMVVLESAVGIIFVFLLVSLLVTSANELIAGILGLRASNLREGIDRMLAGDSKAAKAFFDHPAIRLASKSSRRGPSYIDSGSFSETLCDYISSAGRYARLGAHYLEGFDLAASIDAAPLPADVKKIAASFAIQAKGDVLEFKAKLGAWFDQSMERVSGWYIRKMRLLSLVVGLAIAAAANIDSIAIASSLAADETARSALVGQAVAYLSEEGDAPQPAPQPAPGAAMSDSQKDELKKNVDDLLSRNLIGWSEGPRLFGTEGSVPRWTFWLMKALGFLATALAGSLGAPFWFDLLGKLVNMRSSLAAKKPA